MAPIIVLMKGQIIMTTYKWKYQFLTDKVAQVCDKELEDLEELEAKLERKKELKEKADELRFLENFIASLTRDHSRKIKELNDKQRELAEEIEAELNDIEAAQKGATT